MTISAVAVAVFCVLLLILAFLLPRRSRGPERGGAMLAGAPKKPTGKAPGKPGRWLSKPFDNGQRAIHKSAGAGRKSRDRMPF